MEAKLRRAVLTFLCLVLFSFAGAAAFAVAEGEDDWDLQNETSSDAELCTIFIGGKKLLSWLNATLLEEEVRSVLPGDEGQTVVVVNATQEHDGLSVVLELDSNRTIDDLSYTVSRNRTAFEESKQLFFCVGVAFGVKSWQEKFGYEGSERAGLAVSIVVPSTGLAMIVAIAVTMVATAMRDKRRATGNSGGGGGDEKLVEMESSAVTPVATVATPEDPALSVSPHASVATASTTI